MLNLFEESATKEYNLDGQYDGLGWKRREEEIRLL